MSSTTYRPNILQRIVLRLAASRPGGALLARVLRPLDTIVSRSTGGKATLTQFVTGLPIIELTTFGARSGLPRTCPAVGFETRPPMPGIGPADP